MIFHYQKTRKVVEVLNDLIRIHNDRIAGYQLALESLKERLGLHESINDIILDSMNCKQQLTLKVKELDADAAKNTTLFGKIYRVWVDLKIKFSVNTRKAIISSCQYNEEIALHVYNAAISESELNAASKALLQTQEATLRQALNTVKGFREVRQFKESSLIYFN